MDAKIIIIDGYIGQYGFSKQFIRNELSGNEKNPVTAQISSLGGAVDHALNIYDQFIAHGNVTAELSAFVASSATIIALGAKTIRMNENSFFLIHKAMNWVDEWGTMNEDEIEELINKLEKQKQQLAKVTLQIAKMYVKRTGQTLEAILDLMKQEIWLTAEEALEKGFIDEIYAPEAIQNYLDNSQMVAMITASGYPAPARKSEIKTPDAKKPNEVEDSFVEKLYNKFVARFKAENSNSQNITSMNKFELLNTVLDVESLESVDNQVSFNEEQLQAVETELSTRAQKVVELQANVVTANTERDTAVTNAATAADAFNEIDASIADAKTPEAKVEAIRTLLAKKPGTQHLGNLGEGGEGGDAVNWDSIDNLPHNKTVDQNS